MSLACRRCGAVIQSSGSIGPNRSNLCVECASAGRTKTGSARVSEDQIIRWLEGSDEEETEAAFERS